jgi:hypothetical protein
VCTVPGKVNLWPCANQVLLWVNMTDNRNSLTAYSESRRYRIKKSVSRIMLTYYITERRNSDIPIDMIVYEFVQGFPIRNHIKIDPKVLELRHDTAKKSFS